MTTLTQARRSPFVRALPVLVAWCGMRGAGGGDAERWLQLAQQARDTQTRLRFLDQAVRAAPDSWMAWGMRAEAHLSQRGYDFALADAAKAIQLDPSQWAPWAIRGEANLGLKRYQEAIDDGTQSIQRKPDNAAAHLVRGEAYLRMGKARDAADDAATALYLKPLDPQALRIRARARLLMGRPAQAIEDLNALLDLNAEDQSLLAQRAKALANAGRLDECLRDCDRLAQLDPESPEPLLLKAEILADKRKFAEAAAASKQAIERSPGNARLWLALGQVLARAERKTEAVEAIDRALRLRPDYADAFASRAEARRLAGDCDGAIADATKALEIDARCTYALSSRAAALSEREDWAKALEDLAAALERDPEYRFALRLRSRVFRMTHEWDPAIRDARRLVECSQTAEETADGYVSLGLAYAAKGLYRLSLDVLSQAIELDPDEASAHFARANAHRMNGEPELGLPDCNAGMRLDPKSAFGPLLLGVCYFQMEQFAPARRHLEIAAQLDVRGEWTAWVHAFTAEMHRQEKHFGASIGSATRALAARPKVAHPMAYVVRAASHRGLKQYRQAVADATEALHLRDSLAFAYAERGAAYRGLREYAKTIEDCDQAVSLMPLLDLAYHERAYALLSTYRGEHVQAQGGAAMLAAIMTGLGGPDVPFEVARSRPVEQGHAPPAHAASALVDRPYSPEPVDQGAASRETHPLDRAVADFRMLQRLGYRRRSCIHGLAMCLHEMGRFTDAVTVCDDELGRGDGAAELLLTRAMARYALGDVAAGLADAQRAAETDVTSAEARLALAYGRALRSRWPEVQADCETAWRQDPEPQSAARILLLQFAAAAHGDVRQGALRGLAERVHTANMDEWPAPILTALVEREDLRSFAARACQAAEPHVTKGRLCQATYYYGVADLAADRPVQARSKFRRSVSLGSERLVECSLAAAELGRGR